MDPSDLFHRLLQLHGLLLATFAYCVFVVRPLQPGWHRLVASLPAFVVFSLSPFFVKDSAVLSSGIGLTILWVANFKLLAYTGGRGALSHPGLRTPLQWGALLVLPFFPAKNNRALSEPSFKSVVLGLLVKLGVWLGLTGVLVSVELSPTARHLCYAVHFWMFVSLCLDAAMPIGRQLVAGVPLQPAMDGPYAAKSVREFWGRRYNQIVSATLLETIYKPIVEGCWVVKEAAGPSAAASAEADDASVKNGSGKGGKVRPRAPVALAGLFASFLVSGIMHEICLWFSCGCWLEGSFRMFGFFLLQPLIIVVQDSVEALAKNVVPEHLRNSFVTALLQKVVTLSLVLWSAEWFWGPMESCGADKRGLQEVDSAMRWLLGQVGAPGLLGR
ncbi:hypothetical protein VaNZ11_011477 [Volvox africanus]|uniref:Wax synthase domain-containing protein n=1 Tax=Volvox africanus TaxID=51714 RepID=A0ABQ5SBP5_9CHLO|nr:hypothetical protein VaNZ11_011477 [Volvox africanus]